MSPPSHERKQKTEPKIKSVVQKAITKNYSNGLWSGMEYKRANGEEGLGLVFNDLFEILRDGMGQRIKENCFRDDL